MSETVTSSTTTLRGGIAADMTGFVGIRLACTTAIYRRLVAWPIRGMGLAGMGLAAADLASGLRPRKRLARTVAVRSVTPQRCVAP